MAERKLHQLKKTIRQLELAGGGRNVEMRREFNSLLGQYLAQGDAKPLQGGGFTFLKNLLCKIPGIKTIGWCESASDAAAEESDAGKDAGKDAEAPVADAGAAALGSIPEWFNTEITDKGTKEFNSTLGSGIEASDDQRKAEQQFQALKNSGLKIAKEHEQKTTELLQRFMTGTEAKDIICLQEGPPTLADFADVPSGYTMIHPGEDSAGPPVVFFRGGDENYNLNNTAVQSIAKALKTTAGENYVYWRGTNTSAPAKILIVPLIRNRTPLTVVSYHANSGGASKWNEQDMDALAEALKSQGDYIICADTNAKKSINGGNKAQHAANFATKLQMQTVYPGQGTATCNKTRTIMQAQPSKAGDTDYSLKDIIGCSTGLTIKDGTGQVYPRKDEVSLGLPSESFPSDHAYVEAIVSQGTNEHKVVQWNAAWIADSWAEFVLPAMGNPGNPPSAAHFNRFFLNQMDTYFKATLGEDKYNAMHNSTNSTIPKGWTVFYALASACGKRDQTFSTRSHIVDICKARNEEEFKASLSVVPPISGHSPPTDEDGRKNNISNAPTVDGTDDRMLQLYYGAHKYVCNMLTQTKAEEMLGTGPHPAAFLDAMQHSIRE